MSDPQDQFQRLSTSGQGPIRLVSNRERSAAKQTQEAFAEQFRGLAQSPEEFHQLLQRVYGQGYDRAQAESFRQRALAGDTSWMPQIKYLEAAAMNGGSGAYDAKTNTVYLSRELLNDPSQAAAVYAEEVGHFLDTKLNKVDSQGDEGELFRRLLSGEKLSAAQEAEIRAENDKGVVYVNGKATEVEFFFKKIGKAIGKVVKGVAKGVGKVVKGVGNVVKKGVDLVKKGFAAVGNVVGKAVNGVSGFLKKIPLVGGVLNKVFTGVIKGLGALGKIPGLSMLLNFIPGVGPVLGFLSKIPGLGLLSKGLSWVNTTLGKFTGFVGGIRDKVTGFLGKGVNWVNGVLNKGANAVSGWLGKVPGVGNWLGTQAQKLLGKGVDAATNWLRGQVDRVGNLFNLGVNKVTGFVKKFTDPLQDFLNAVKNRAVSSGKSLWDGITESVSGVFKNIGEAGRTFGDAFGRLFRGDFRGAAERFGSALVKIGQTPIDAIAIAGGHTISAIQTALGLEPVGRRLTADETNHLRGIFGDSIDYSSVTVKEGNVGILGLSGRPFVLGNTIYVPGGLNQHNDPMGVLAHEMTHVWQHQNGGTDYLSEALWAQNFGQGYNIGRALADGKGFAQMNPEQQAQLIESALERGWNPAGDNRRYLVQLVDPNDKVGGYRVAVVAAGSADYNNLRAQGYGDYSAVLNDAFARLRSGDAPDN